MIKVEPQEYETYRQWVVNTQTRWCSFLVQRFFYEDGVVLEEIDFEDDRVLEQYVLEGLIHGDEESDGSFELVKSYFIFN